MEFDCVDIVAPCVFVPIYDGKETHSNSDFTLHITAFVFTKYN